MSFSPIIPAGGLVGWRFLNRTLERQQSAFSGDKALQREEVYFRANIGKVRTAGELVADRRLLAFALDAFGLGGDLANRAFVRKVLESRSGDSGALANKLADKRYREFAGAFGFAEPGGPRTTLSARVERIVGQWRQEQFEQAVGTVDEDMRIALNARSEIARIADQAGTDDGRWYAVLGSAPLRAFIQTALALPSSFASIDLDKQVATLRGRLRSTVGESEVSALSDPGKLEKLTRAYFLRSDTAASASSGTTALTLLSQAAAGNRLSRRF